MRMQGRPILTALAALALLTALTVIGCDSKKTGEPGANADKSASAPTTAAADKTFGAQPTPPSVQKPIHGRIMSLNDARKLSLLPVVEPEFLPDGVALQQVRVDKGDALLSAERVYLIYAASKAQAPLKKGRLWEGINVQLDGGTSIPELTTLKDPIIIEYELTPKRPEGVSELPGVFVADDTGRSLSRQEWWSQPGISYRLFSNADRATMQKIAESIPRPVSSKGFPAYSGETVVTGKEMTMIEVGKDPILRQLTPRRPSKIPAGSSIRMLLGEYQPDDKVATLRLIYSSQALPKVDKTMSMNNGDEVPVANGHSIQSFKDDIKGGMLLTFRTEEETPTDLGVPVKIGEKSVYFLKSFVSGQSKRPLPNEAHWHEPGQHISFYADLPKESLVRVAGSLPLSAAAKAAGK